MFRCHGHQALPRLDQIMKTSLESIVNIKLDETQWMQATLPISEGGLGIRRVNSLASSAYLASAAITADLQTDLLCRCLVSPDSYLADLLDSRSDSLPSSLDPLPTKQNIWDRPLVEKCKSIVWTKYDNPVHRARLTAACSPHSGDWLAALPIPPCGLCLNNEAVRVAIGLRLGLEICKSHSCRCGATVSNDRHHGLICKLAFG